MTKERIEQLVEEFLAEKGCRNCDVFTAMPVLHRIASEAKQEACNLICQGCREGIPVTTDGMYLHRSEKWLGGFHVCHAAAIRASGE